MDTQDDKKQEALRRLRSAQGQVRDLQRMVEDGCPAGDLLGRIATTQQALRAAGVAVTQRHLKASVAEVVRSGDPFDVRRTCDETTELLYRHIP